ncbi:ribosomal-processing cysteine protease Prp [Limosilactobacillus agrestis]|uniref:ribosomal-processing cysteine protease Prp n=1 Tax=Limosilactobacillus agrestis TaxID=2759748 RepID=UPI001E5E1A1D|nr:ribosomal-processing cysteine protease Prp [Limosilactobacillus agrestis]MCD7113435.1 ribosomal-processing cysteine protease Prp [Limosilactobacillus agrestis]
MIQVQITKEKNKTTITASGHAGYSVHGSDIVCASFSTLLTHTINNCTGVSVKDERGLFTAKFEDVNSIGNQTMLKAFENTVNQLAEQYGKYITVEEVSL